MKEVDWKNWKDRRDELKNEDFYAALRSGVIEHNSGNNFYMKGMTEDTVCDISKESKCGTDPLSILRFERKMRNGRYVEP